MLLISKILSAFIKTSFKKRDKIRSYLSFIFLKTSLEILVNMESKTILLISHFSS